MTRKHAKKIYSLLASMIMLWMILGAGSSFAQEDEIPVCKMTATYTRPDGSQDINDGIIKHGKAYSENRGAYSREKTVQACLDHCQDIEGWRARFIPNENTLHVACFLGDEQLYEADYPKDIEKEADSSHHTE